MVWPIKVHTDEDWESLSVLFSEAVKHFLAQEGHVAKKELISRDRNEQASFI
jgi:hypothetical protein